MCIGVFFPVKYSFEDCFATLSMSRLYSIKWWDDSWIGRDLGGRDAVIEVLSRYLFGEAETNWEIRWTDFDEILNFPSHVRFYKDQNSRDRTLDKNLRADSYTFLLISKMSYSLPSFYPIYCRILKVCKCRGRKRANAHETLRYKSVLYFFFNFGNRSSENAVRILFWM
jgi:hypothetical protein